MSSGLNAEFKKSPLNFLTAHMNIQSSNYRASGVAGPIYSYKLLNNIGSFDLTPSAHRPGMTALTQHDGAWLTEAAIKAYYLNAAANQTLKIPLGKDAEYFFTDSITGCAFMAWGTSRQNLMVMHANALDKGKIDYMKQALALRAMRPPFLIIYTYQDYQKGVLRDEDPAMVVTTLTGKRLADGWHFYTRSYIGIGGGAVGMGNMQPRGLQPTGIEIDPE